MTRRMAIDCPTPPQDFSLREVPEDIFNIAASTLYRVHRTEHQPLFFNRRSTSSCIFRFDAAHDEFGVLYAAPSFEACMAETVIRDSFEKGSLPLTIDYNELACRSIASIGLSTPRVLHVADFTQPLFSIGGNGQILTVSDYRIPNLWSSAVHAHPTLFDGIVFRSRFSNMLSVALFDRVELVVRGSSVPLLQFHELEPFLERYSIGIV